MAGREREHQDLVCGPASGTRTTHHRQLQFPAAQRSFCAVPGPARDIHEPPGTKERKQMNFLSQLLRGIAFVPALVSGMEGLFASKFGSREERCRLEKPLLARLRC